ncbi:MAG: hypothetical protein DRP22_05245, partial [Verrucomicrobia bacterium]
MNTSASSGRETESASRLTLACKITILRIMLVPLFILLLLYYTLSIQRGSPNEYQRLGALILFLVIALTDALDGFVARLRREITELGRILDPLADKLLLLSALVLLTRPSISGLQPQFPIAFTLLVISRDILLILGAAIVHAVVGELKVRPRALGKAATALQMAAVVWALAGWPVAYFRTLVW